MRDVLVLLTLLVVVPLGLARAELGLLIWSWVTLMHPHRLIYSFLAGAHLDMMGAFVALSGWLVSREKLKEFRSNPTFILLIFLGLWVTVSYLFAIGNIPKAYLLWDRTIKTLIWALALHLVFTSKQRLHALIWIMVLSV